MKSLDFKTAVNTWAVSVIGYSEGVIERTIEELKTPDRKTRTLSFENGALHQMSNVISLCTLQKVGGHLIREECVTSET